ncbi:hypothetical protein HHUSO_G12642 [Huso huso]|uniref:Uncharacterized protein n=1 Tax=Huso huso TaxID=61971 RepID=A0ABR0ZJ06_HUSHU
MRIPCRIARQQETTNPGQNEDTKLTAIGPFSTIEKKRVPTQHRPSEGILRSHKPKARIASILSNPDQRWAGYRSRRTETSPAFYSL